MSNTVYSVNIRTEEDVVTVRRVARDVAAALGFDHNDRTRIGTAVSEIARNAFQYASGGIAEFLFEPAGRTYTIRIRDRGTGIPNLKKILSGTYCSRTGMGLGILGARRLMDRLQIESEPGRGTIVELSRSLPERASCPTVQRLSALAAELDKAVPRNALEELREQNREQLRLLEELRARQEELERLNSELEDTNRGVVALYAELDEKAERLRRADEMKSRFLSHMSHEFRTPLTSIMALGRLLMEEADGTLSSEQQKQVTFIRRSAESLLEMVNDLLDLARVEAGKSIVRPSSFQISNLFGALRSVLRPLRVSQEVELVFEDPTGFPALFTDEAKVAQILRNFISNALKFTERGEVRVSARLNAERNRVIFSVADTGIGIEPEHLDLIFQEFTQLDTPIQSRFRGTGLGLPLSKGFAELLGGRVYAESESGRGSTFSAEIPLVYAGAETHDTGQPAACDLLLIEDEEVSRYLLQQSLSASWKTAEAVDGPSGIDAARKLSPRAILLDLRMPGMSGFDVLRELRKDPLTRNIPVLIMTSQALSADERYFLNSEAVGVLSKDILSQPDAGRLIRAALEGKHDLKQPPDVVVAGATVHG